MKHPKCKDCEHYRRVNSTSGECRPGRPKADEDGAAYWPRVDDIETGCGEYAEGNPANRVEGGEHG